jgi:nucleoside-diphosphate-sugar epimerase
MLGSFVVRELQRRGKPVRVLARESSAGAARKAGVDVAIGDLADGDSLRRATRGVDGIVHAACTFSRPEVDIAAMAALLEAWERGPFVFISGVAVYGLSPRWLPITEDHPLDDTSPYGQGKIRCEALLADAACAKQRADWSILRPPHIWGPDLRSIAHQASPVGGLYRRAVAGQPLVLPGATEAEWSTYGDDWVDARELAWAAAECLDRPLGEPANAINSHFIWHDFCQELIRLTGSRSALQHTAAGDDFFAQPWTCSAERLAQRLGFRPQYQWQETLATASTGGPAGPVCSRRRVTANPCAETAPTSSLPRLDKRSRRPDKPRSGPTQENGENSCRTRQPGRSTG